MRVGQNPAKAVKSVAQPAQVSVAVVTYIPFLGGYYAESLEVLKLCLGSIWDHTYLPYDLMVFDNASCPEVRAYLLDAHAQGRIQYLTLSESNVGKVGAWNYLFGAAPGEFVAYADSDVYFFPGWLEPQVEILKTVPKVGMVTGLPMLTPAEYSTSTVAWAEAEPEAQLARGRFLPWQDFWRHARSLGVEEGQARQFYQENEDLLLTYRGRRYYVGGAHFQFVARRAVLQEVIPLPSERPMGQVRALDAAINQRGYLRLCTEKWHAQHMGNVAPEERDLAPEAGLKSPRPARRRRPKGLARFGPLRSLLYWIYHRSFEILYKG